MGCVPSKNEEDANRSEFPETLENTTYVAWSKDPGHGWQARGRTITYDSIPSPNTSAFAKWSTLRSADSPSWHPPPKYNRGRAHSAGSLPRVSFSRLGSMNVSGVDGPGNASRGLAGNGSGRKGSAKRQGFANSRTSATGSRIGSRGFDRRRSRTGSQFFDDTDVMSSLRKHRERLKQD